MIFVYVLSYYRERKKARIERFKISLFCSTILETFSLSKFLIQEKTQISDLLINFKYLN